MTGKRKRRKTDDRLDDMAQRVDVLGADENDAGRCPKCDGEMLGSKVEIEQGTCSTFRCTACGYLYMQRS